MMYGVDVGGTKIEVAIFDNNLERLESWRVATPKQDYQAFLTAIVDMVREADQKTGTTGSVGIGCPGFVDQQGYAVAANISCINGQPLMADITQSLGRPVAFENDVKAFVLSEANGGAADGAQQVLGIVLGTGVSGGQCIDGQLYYGKQHIAGEYGHIPLPAILQQRYKLPIRRCGCGSNKGCVEQYLSGPGLLWMCTHFGQPYASVPELIEGLRNNEQGAHTIFNAYVDCLGSYFAQLTLMFDPDVIVLGGGISNITELYQQLPDAVAAYLFKGVSVPVIVPPKFGDSSGVRGAAILGHRLPSSNEAIQ